MAICAVLADVPSYSAPDAVRVVIVADTGIDAPNFLRHIEVAIAPQVVTVDAPVPGILEVLPAQVIERPYAVTRRQNRAPPRV